MKSQIVMMVPSLWHLIIFVGIVLLFFGPNRLPGLGKSLGEAIRGFKKGLNDDDIEVGPQTKRIESDSATPQQKVTQTQKQKEEV